MSTNPNPEPTLESAQEPPPESKPARPTGRIGEDWTALFAFGLPSGSIRALLAIMILGTACGLVAYRPDLPLPEYLRDLAFLILGHYFALRREQGEPEQLGPAPLFLPRGTIRLLILAGIVTVIVILVRRGAPMRPSESPAATSLILVTGFLLGVVSRLITGWLQKVRGVRSHRIFADLRAVVAILSAVVLVAVAWNQVHPFLPLPRDAAELPGRARRNIIEYGLEHYLGAIIGFYFGARS